MPNLNKQLEDLKQEVDKEFKEIKDELEEKTQEKTDMKHAHKGGDYLRINYKDLLGTITGTSSFSTAYTSTVSDSRFGSDNAVLITPTSQPVGNKWHASISKGQLQVISDNSSETMSYRYVIYKI